MDYLEKRITFASFFALFAHSRRIGGPSRNRTGVQGFAVLCVTTPPSGLGAAQPFREVGVAVKPSDGHVEFDEWWLARGRAADMSAAQLELEVY